MGKFDELFDSSNAHMLDGDGDDSSAGYEDIPDAPDWVAHAVDELKEIAEYFDRHGKKKNGDFLRRTANMLEVLAGAYETAKRRSAGG